MKGVFVIFAVVAAASAASFAGVTVVDPMDVVGIAGSKIYLKDQSTRGMDFAGYVDFCQRNGLRTASILSPAEHEVVRSYINSNNFGYNMWLGGWDINHEGKYTWIETAQPFVYADWGRDVVGKDRPVYNCAFIGSRPGGAKFYDSPCTTSWFIPLCEAKLVKEE